MIILATSFCGAYLSVRSLSLLIGKDNTSEPDFRPFSKRDFTYSCFANSGSYISGKIWSFFLIVKVEWPFYVYMNAVIMITVFSMCAQYKIKRYYEKKKQMFEFEAGDYIKNEEV